MSSLFEVMLLWYATNFNDLYQFPWSKDCIKFLHNVFYYKTQVDFKFCIIPFMIPQLCSLVEWKCGLHALTSVSLKQMFSIFYIMFFTPIHWSSLNFAIMSLMVPELSLFYFSWKGEEHPYHMDRFFYFLWHTVAILCVMQDWKKRLLSVNLCCLLLIWICIWLTLNGNVITWSSD
jgi:hypothetical protein